MLHLFYEIKFKKCSRAEIEIQVCDELRHKTKVFKCPRNLLLSQMAYFADVTSGNMSQFKSSIYLFKKIHTRRFLLLIRAISRFPRNAESVNLINLGQRLEDMDISVHCDLTIFEWLMKWVKSTSNNENVPTLRK